MAIADRLAPSGPDQQGERPSMSPVAEAKSQLSENKQAMISSTTITRRKGLEVMRVKVQEIAAA